MPKLAKEDVQKRDRLAQNYSYFKPIKGEIYKGQNKNRKHLCQKCNGISLVQPYNFWKGVGCQACSSAKGKKQELSMSAVQDRDSKALNAKKYPPNPNQVYINQYTKRKHSCAECGFKGEMTPKSFWMNRGCPKCGAKKGSNNKIENAKKTVEQKDKATKIYELYPPISGYTGVDKYRKHQCVICGHIGNLKPDNFWYNERGCPVCGAANASQNKRANNKVKAPSRDKKAAHWLTYPPISEYTGTFEHRDHLCSSCGYKGRVIPNNFWRGRGCPICASSGFDKESPAIMYYLKVEVHQGNALYKIGITNKTVKERYNNTDLARITVLKEWQFDIGKKAFMKEKLIKDKYKMHVYGGEKILFSGNTELFTSDILNLDKIKDLNL